MHRGIVTKWHGRGFGEALIASLFCHILNDNGIKAVYEQHHNSRGLLDAPLYNSKKHKGWVKWKWKYKLNDVPIIQQQVDKASKWLEKDIMVLRDHVPVVFREMDVPEIDVVMNTKTGIHSPYKMWPYFAELKTRMAKLGITYYDLDASETYKVECLNMVKKARIFLGLDTGMGHYVSRFANGKTLILNGGFVTFQFWASLYDYEPIQVEDVPCRPCYLTHYHVKNDMACKYENMCMRDISVNMVMDKIYERLK